MLFWMVGGEMMSGGLGWVGTDGLVVFWCSSLWGDAVGGGGSAEGGGVGGGEGWVGTDGSVVLLCPLPWGDVVGGAGGSSEGGEVGGGEVVCMPESRVTNGPMKGLEVALGMLFGVTVGKGGVFVGDIVKP